MKRATLTFLALAFMAGSAAMAEPEIRRAIPVAQAEAPAMPADTQTRRAIPVAQAAIDAEMQAAAEATANPAPAPAEPPVDRGVGANVLWRKYDQNPIAADNKYRGAIRTITGTVKDIGRDILGNPYVVLGDGRIFGGVQCTFSTSDEAEIAELRKGQALAIRGEIKGLILFNVLVNDCWFVEMPPVVVKKPAEETPAPGAKARRPAVPAEVMATIRANAESEWPDDYSMQRYEIKRQVEAYLDLHE